MTYEFSHSYLPQLTRPLNIGAILATTSCDSCKESRGAR
jgi:hypothetical protein